MAENRDQLAVAVPWDEAREVLAVVLVVAAMLHLVAPMIRYMGLGSEFSLWEDLYGLFTNVNALTGGLLLGAAVTVSTTPSADVVPKLRWIVFLVAAATAGLAMITIINLLTVRGMGDSATFRMALIVWRPGPAVLLSAAAAWMARRVVTFT